MMTTTTLQKQHTTRIINFKLLFITLFMVGYLLAMYIIWKATTALWIKLTITFGLPLLLGLILLLVIIGFAHFLPKLSCYVGNRSDRTVRNSDGNYQSTFLITGQESNGTREVIQVEIEPNGGNEWHYHKTIEEKFTVVKGQLMVGVKGKEVLLYEGQTATVSPGTLHYFRNKTAAIVTILVEVSPALGLEKSIRIAYGLANTGQWEKNTLFPRNPWHLFLLLGYSQTYLPYLPGFIQEPLVDGLARIAQWKGEDRTLETFFK